MSKTTELMKPRAAGSLPVRYNNNSGYHYQPPPQSSSTPLNGGKEELNLSPLITTSGYLTKKSRGLGSRWLRRWWQLLGDGTLIYFKGEERLKVLGEIDIAHTCYDVKLGGEYSRINYPAVIPTNCCFSVSVLKRTYYLFAPNPTEASKWAECLRSASYLLNRSRSRALSASPAVLVASEELEDTPPSPPSVPPPPSSYKPPPPPPLMSSSVDEGSDDEHKDLPSFKNLAHGQHNLSVPDLRFDYSFKTSSNGRGGRVKSVYNSFHSSTSQSSNSQPSPSQHHHQSLSPRSSLQLPSTNKRRSNSFLVSPIKHNMSPSGVDASTKGPPATTRQHRGGDSSKKSGDGSKHRKGTKGDGGSNARKKQSKNESVTHRNKLESKQHSWDQTSRSSLSHWYTSQGDLRNNSTTLPSPGKLARSKWKSEFDTTGTDFAFDRLEQLQKQEEDIKRRLRELQKAERMSYIGPSRGVPVLPPLSPMENMTSPAYPFVGDFPPSHRSQPEPESNRHDNNVSDVNLRRSPPRKPPRKAPKPVLRRIQTPYIDSFTAEGERMGDEENMEPVETDTQTQIMSFNNDSKRKSSAIRSHEANVWVKSELAKLVEQIKLHGSRNKDNEIVIEFGKLVDRTDGMFEAILGTILTARKHEIVEFDGDILLKGQHDHSLITLLDENLTTPKP